MAASKYQFARLRIIDRELQRRRRVKTKDLVQIIRNELDINVSSRTIQNDIALMQYDSTLGYYAPIEKDPKVKAWYYADSTYTITAFKLQEEEIKSLSFYANMLGAYRETGIFNRFSAAIEKVLDAVAIQKSASDDQSPDDFIQIDSRPPYRGSEFLLKILTAIREKRQLQFEYQKFVDDEPQLRTVCPYLLKSFENRWYLVAKREGRIATYGTDRIQNPEILNAFFEKEAIDFNTYFKDSIGITVTDEAPVEIILSFTPLQGKYVKSLPLHASQKTIVDNQEELRISVFVRPTFELYSKLMSYGASVRVVSPQGVAEELKGRIENTLSLYMK